ncbi:unnamed protein product [Miscanthus lutarioriparius]|uniref:Retrovirus-related Pol polyprotein from transposon TNT 1-94-like beta-barrel domain-containing protein n=1 Tax=Miscanthus lutarioriparius TaxID=422564 RepID=A0A811P4V9_9POAL|nr:unnamed protein product [Miscanthus lutarioriparius]
MASMKFDLPLLDYKTRFALWQVKMRAILAQSLDLDEALDGFGGKGQKSWTAVEKRKGRKALFLIQLHLHNDILQEVLQVKTAVELWLKLELICMSKDLTSKMHVKMKLFTHKLQEGGSVMNHLSIFKDIVADLVSIENKEKRNGTYKPKNKSDGDGKASVVFAADSSDSGDVLVVLAGCVASRDEWILDSACSFHICSNRDWFSSYKSTHSGDVVRMGDNNPREIVGIGSVEIKMHDGMIRTLKRCETHTGDGKISSPSKTLDAEGYKHSGSVECKVSKGSLIHMIGDMNSTKLYVLRGSTLHGSITAATISNDEPSKTNLQHMCLGHMSELGMM